MFKTTVKYEDYLGTEREETLRFNLTEVEMKDLMEDDVAFAPAFLKAISDDRDNETMFRVIRKMILHAYGEISEDGRYFRKSEQIMSDFAHSAAYTALLEKLLTGDDDTLITDFLYGVFPSKIAAAMRASDSQASSQMLQSAT